MIDKVIESQDKNKKERNLKRKHEETLSPDTIALDREEKEENDIQEEEGEANIGILFFSSSVGSGFCFSSYPS